MTVNVYDQSVRHEKDKVYIWEKFVKGSVPLAASPLLSFTGVAVQGIYVVSCAIDLAAATNTLTRQLQEFTATTTADRVAIAVGDLFIPFNPAIGAGAGTLDATLVVHPAVAITAHKVPVVLSNLTAAATNAGAITFKFLWIKVA